VRRHPEEDTARPHVSRVLSTETDRRALAASIDAGQVSDAEVEYYEAFSDPAARAMNRDRRRRHGQYLR
jgi:hypothetical protein